MSSPRRFSLEIRGSDILISVGVAALYIAAAKLGLGLAFQAQQVTAVWPPTGLALAAVLRYGRRAVPGVLLGAFFANATADEPLWVAGGIALGNTLEALTASALLKHVGFDGRLARLRDVTSLLGALAVAPAVSATIGVASLGAGGVQPASSLPELWSVWWLGDALGGLIFAPLLLLWTNREAIPRRRFAAVEGAAVLAGLFVGCVIAFSELPPAPVSEYIVFPFLIWGALRFGPLGTATVAAAADVFAVWGTHAGFGPFAGAGPEHGLVLLQIFMAVAATTGLLLGAAVAHQRRAQESAQVSEDRLLMALEGARMGVWDWNLATSEVRWSAEVEPLQGLPRGGFAGTYDAFRALIHPDDRDRVESAIRKSVETGEPYEAQFRIVGADGIERWTDARGHVIEDAGKPVRMVGVAVDVSSQKQLEEQLRRHADQLSETDKRKDEFLAMLAHELRNPLAPILHAVELLGRRDPAVADRAREIIRRQSQHLTKLVDDLLDVSRITRGTVRLDLRRVTLGDVIAPAIDAWRHLIAQRGQELTVEIPERSLWLEVDSTRIAQAISNLVHNAANFTPPGGRIAIVASEEDGWVALRIRDTGVGMEPDILARVFDLFAQGPPPPDRPQEGLGLGLTLVRRLVDLHGGTVEGRSEGLGRGSEFVVRLPMAAAGPVKDVLASRAQPAGETPADTDRARRVLVVDDNDDAREALEFLLKEEGHDVRGAADGAEALAEAKSFQPDVVLLDIGLPGMDGYDVARALRATPESAGAFIVAVSGYGQAEDRVRSRAAGFDQHLLKPVAPARLLDLVRQPMRREA